jgi:hypothetical protein
MQRIKGELLLQRGILVLDLEKAVSKKDTDRHLENGYAQADDFHALRKPSDQALDEMGFL